MKTPTIDILTRNQRDGLRRMAYPITADEIAMLPNEPIATGNGRFQVGPCVTWEAGEPLFVTIHRVGPVLFARLESRKELTA